MYIEHYHEFIMIKHTIIDDILKYLIPCTNMDNIELVII